jgi:17beta-estradiol 17-dehydrogenase / very-long-chain 3-oxoacyl-CoA reductase
MGIFLSKRPSVMDVTGRNTAAAPSWALITGATTGIGRDMAHELCKRGFNTIIHGRDRNRLDDLAAILRRTHSVEVHTLLLDSSTAFATEESAAATESIVWEQVEDLNLRLVVNNVGTGHDPKGFKTLTSSSAGEVSHLINVNTTFMTNLTRILLPVLQKSSSPKDEPPSMVINAGSLADIGLPYMSAYSGTKAYIRAFSRALDVEMAAENLNIRVVAVIIGDTDSDGHRVARNLSTPGSEAMATMILDAAGKSRGGTAMAYWVHGMQEMLCYLQPFWILRMGMVMHFRQMMAEIAKKR